MEFTELADYPLPTGALTAWSPTSGDDPTAWECDERPLTFVHEEYCRQRPLRGSDEASWLGSAFVVPHRLDGVAFAHTLRTWALRHESLRTTVTETVDAEGNSRISRLTNRTDDISIATEHLSDSIGGTDLRDYLEQFFIERLHPRRWPHALFTTVHNESDDHFLVVFAADHSVMDAYSLLVTMTEIQSLYAATLSGQQSSIALPATGSHVQFSADERAAYQELDFDHPAALAWRDFLAKNDNAFPAFPLAVCDPVEGCTPAPRQRGLSNWLLTATECAALSDAGRAMGASTKTVVVGALSAAIATVADEPTTSFVMPMHTRHTPEYATSVGWYVGIIPVHFTVPVEADTPTRLAAAADALRAGKPLAQIPYPLIARTIGNSSAPRFVISYVDVRSMPNAADWPTWQARTLRGASFSDNEVYLWVVRTLNGLNVSARFPDGLTSITNVQRMIDAFGAALAGVAHFGTYYPETTSAPTVNDLPVEVS